MVNDRIITVFEYLAVSVILCYDRIIGTSFSFDRIHVHFFDMLRITRGTNVWIKQVVFIFPDMLGLIKVDFPILIVLRDPLLCHDLLLLLLKPLCLC